MSRKRSDYAYWISTSLLAVGMLGHVAVFLVLYGLKTSLATAVWTAEERVAVTATTIDDRGP